MSVAPQVEPSLGPIIGGLLGNYLGWHAIFWFLFICTGGVFIPASMFLVETGRNVVGDRSIPPARWTRCYLNATIEKRVVTEDEYISYKKRDELAMERKLKFPNPLETVKIIFIKEAGYMLTYIGILCCGYYATVSLIPSQFGRIYGFNQIQIVLCHLPQSAVVSVRSSSWSHLACYQTQ